MPSSTACSCCDILRFVDCRILRTDIEFPSSAAYWKVIVPEHDKHVLEWAAALKVKSVVLHTHPMFHKSLIPPLNCTA